MTDTLGKIKNFVNYVRHTLKGDEKGEDQFFYEALFKAFGHKGCREAGAQTQFRVKSPGQHTKFADLVWRPRLLLEMKSRGEKLEKHHQQVFEYWDKLIPQPRYVVLCNFDEFWIYDTTLQIEEPVNRVKLEELPKQYNALDFLFPGNAGVEPHGRGTAMPCPYENIPPSGAVQLFGREQELERLHELLTPPAPLAKGGEQLNKLFIAAIVGMGGVGKTELAIQYAWHHLQGLGDGAGGVCWVDGRDGDIGIQLVNFARSLLNLNPPEDWDLVTQLKYCWRNWQKGDWLIVIDDVTNYRQQVKPYLPPESSQFKVLLTAREEFGRPVEHLALDKLQPQAALDLLTSLVGAERIQQESDIAEQLCQWLDYLPLGLELVGRYLERDQDRSLKAMLSLLEKKRLRHRSVLEADSTMTAKLGVADAFELSWERLDENAQFLGCLLSLFASADIPWDLVKLAYSNMPSSEDEEIDLDILEEARADLVRFNLLQRAGEGIYRLHQLIREFFREKREQSAQVNDLKQAFVAAIVAAAEQIPDTLTLKHIQEAAPAMPHVAEVANDKDLRNLLTDKDLMSPFVGLSRFYESQGLYDQAVRWSEQCLFFTQVRLGLDHSEVALSMSNLGGLYLDQGRYKAAKTLFLQSLQLTKPFLKKDNPQVEMAWGDWAITLNNLAMLYYDQGRYSDAELLCKKSLKLHRLLGNDHPLVATSLNNLAMVYSAQGRYTEAEPLYLQALEIRKQKLGDEHPDVATSLNNLATHYAEQNCYDKAESLYLESLAIYERHVSDKYPNVPATLSNLGSVYISQQRYSQAEPLLIKALELDKQLLGEEHPGVATSLSNLATLYDVQQRYSEGEPLLVQALEIYERCLGSNHPSTVENRKALANLRDRLNSTARDLRNFNQEAKKSNSKKKPKGFGKA